MEVHSDEINLTGLEFFAFHGCLQSEREQGQPFLVDINLKLDLSLAGKSDNLEDTVNYKEIVDLVAKIVEGEPKNLIESVVDTIATNILSKFDKAQEVTVTMHKPHAPIGRVCRDVAVKMVKKR